MHIGTRITVTAYWGYWNINLNFKGNSIAALAEEIFDRSRKTNIRYILINFGEKNLTLGLKFKIPEIYLIHACLAKLSRVLS